MKNVHQVSGKLRLIFTAQVLLCNSLICSSVICIVVLEIALNKSATHEGFDIEAFDQVISVVELVAILRLQSAFSDTHVHLSYFQILTASVCHLPYIFSPCI